jgi:hypothetical protein
MSKHSLLRREIVLIMGAVLIVAAVILRWIAYRS